VDLDLRRDQIGEDFPAILNHGNAGVIARRFYGQYEQTPLSPFVFPFHYIRFASKNKALK
jgi:hypothetical protein